MEIIREEFPDNPTIR